MLIGVPKEIKNHEYRVGMAPASVREAVKHNHQVLVETNAGIGISCSDDEYRRVGAEIHHDGQVLHLRPSIQNDARTDLAAETTQVG